MPGDKHTHKYKRTYLGGRKIIKDDEGKRRIIDNNRFEVFKCMLPGCTSFIQRNLAIGRKSICWNCGEELILDSENTRLAKPTHIHCRKIREVA